jgi:hypothetical protein
VRKLYIYIIILALPILISAQIPGDSLSFVKSRYSSPMLSTNFEKQLQTFNLREQFVYGKQIEKLYLGINQTFFSTIIKSTAISVRDNAFFSLLGQYDFSNLFSFGSNLNYYIYADDKQLAINNSSILNSSAYIKYYPLKKISFTPFLGFSRNEQIGIIDTGPIYGMEALLDNYNFNEFNLFSEFKFQNEDIAPRKNLITSFKFNIDKTFENSYRNKLSGIYSEQRKDFYFETDSLTMSEFDIAKNIQSRTEQRYSIVDRLSVLTPVKGLVFNIDGSIDWRTIDRDTRYISISNVTTSTFDTEIEEFKMNLFSSLQYSSSNFNGIFRVIFSERQEKHKAKYIEDASEIIFEKREEQEKRKNNTSKQISLSGESGFYITSADRITLSLFHRKRIYDTPSELNNDDRDELLSMFGINYYKRMSPFFDLFSTLQGSINNTVYIFKERSANNNTLRVLKLITGGDLHLKSLSSKYSAEVSANYTVYDFEDLNPNLKSYSYRQLALKDSTTLKLFRTTYFRFLGYLKFSEQGDFQWDGFANNPVRYLDERYAEPTIEYRFKHLTFSFGLRYFSLYTYLFDEDAIKSIHTTYTSTAPLSAITYSISNSLYINIKGWYEFINTESNQNNELANLMIRIKWSI